MLVDHSERETGDAGAAGVEFMNFSDEGFFLRDLLGNENADHLV